MKKRNLHSQNTFIELCPSMKSGKMFRPDSSTREHMGCTGALRNKFNRKSSSYSRQMSQLSVDEISLYYLKGTHQICLPVT